MTESRHRQSGPSSSSSSSSSPPPPQVLHISHLQRRQSLKEHLDGRATSLLDPNGKTPLVQALLQKDLQKVQKLLSQHHVNVANARRGKTKGRGGGSSGGGSSKQQRNYKKSIVHPAMERISSGETPLYITAFMGYAPGMELLLSSVEQGEEIMDNNSNNGTIVTTTSTTNGDDPSSSMMTPMSNKNTIVTTTPIRRQQQQQRGGGYAINKSEQSLQRKELRKQRRRHRLLNFPNLDGQTALFAAAAKGHHYCLEYLLKNGADPNKTAKVVSPLQPNRPVSSDGDGDGDGSGDPDVDNASVAKTSSSLSLSLSQLSEHHQQEQNNTYSNNKSMTTSMTDLASHARIKNFSGETALFWAVFTGHVGCVEKLLEFGANVHMTTGDWGSPLYYAAKEQQEQQQKRRQQQQKEHEQQQHQMKNKYNHNPFDDGDDDKFEGDEIMLSLLLERANPRAALKVAMQLNNIHLVKVILDKFSFPAKMGHGHNPYNNNNNNNVGGRGDMNDLIKSVATAAQIASRISTMSKTTSMSGNGTIQEDRKEDDDDLLDEFDISNTNAGGYCTPSLIEAILDHNLDDVKDIWNKIFRFNEKQSQHQKQHQLNYSDDDDDDNNNNHNYEEKIISLIAKTGETALYAAALVGFNDGVKFLLEEANLDPNQQNDDNERLLFTSEPPPPPPQQQQQRGNLFGETPLFAAAAKSNVTALKLLLSTGANPNVAMDVGVSIVPDKFSTLLFSKANYFLGETPLFWAVANDHEECAKILLENKRNRANPNLTGGNWWSPLYMAARNGNINMVDLLLSHGAQPDGVEFNDINGREVDSGMDMPLFVAAKYGHAECVKLLIERGAKPDLPNPLYRTTQGGDSPLVAAVQKGHSECINILLECGANTKKALETAIKSCDQKAVDKILTNDVENGAIMVDEFFQDNEFVKNILSKAENENKTYFVKFLLSREEGVLWSTKHRILKRARIYVQDEDIVLDYLHASLKDLSDQSIEHHTIFLLMIDFYAYCAWVAAFYYVVYPSIAHINKFVHIPGEKKSDTELLPEGPEEVQNSILIGFFFVTSFFMLREFVKMLQEGQRYLSDVWSYIDLLAIGLALATAVIIAFGAQEIVITSSTSNSTLSNSSMVMNDDLNLNETTRFMLMESSETEVIIKANAKFQRIVMATSAFICLSFIGYLKATLLQFSDFVGGVTQIVIDLFPFAIVSSLVVLTFTFIYWVGKSGGKGFDDLKASFYTIFYTFVYGFEDDDFNNLVDIIFAIILGLILLNVLIAIISTSWENAVAKSKKLLCQHRFQLLRQVEGWHIPPNYFVDFINKAYDEDYEKYIDDKIISKLRFSLLGRRRERQRKRQQQTNLEKSKGVDDDDQSENYIRELIWLTIYAPVHRILSILPWILGMISFGLWWPKHVRKSLFGIVGEKEEEEMIYNHTISSSSALAHRQHLSPDSLESRVERIEYQVRQGNEGVKQLQQQMYQLQQALKHVEHLIEKQDKRQ